MLKWAYPPLNLKLLKMTEFTKFGGIFGYHFGLKITRNIPFHKESHLHNFIGICEY